MNEIIENIVDLAAAHVTQYTNDNKKSVWHVRQNVTSKDLYQLDGTLTEKQVFEIMAFARKFELIAFNVGIDFQKKKSDSYYLPKIKGLQKAIGDLTQANERLAEKLQQFIGE